MLQQDQPDDYVVATGETHSVQELVELAFAAADLDWEKHVVIDERFLRPAEVDLLVGDPAKAEKTLGWHREVEFPALVQMMVEADLALVKSQRGLALVMAGLAAIHADPLGLLVAFGAGMLSFLSPCVLPLVPAYLSMVSGLTAAELSPRCDPAPGTGALRRCQSVGVGGAGLAAPAGPDPDSRPGARGLAAPAGPAAPRHPGLHRRVHRGLHHPRGLGVVDRPPLPHPPARPRGRCRAS